ncbi:unnamed protein product [Heterobilharzia americana]|nr:unnamed protein product [Heterobilharzia americana]
MTTTVKSNEDSSLIHSDENDYIDVAAEISKENVLNNYTVNESTVSLSVLVDEMSFPEIPSPNDFDTFDHLSLISQKEESPKIVSENQTLSTNDLVKSETNKPVDVSSSAFSDEPTSETSNNTPESSQSPSIPDLLENSLSQSIVSKPMPVSFQTDDHTAELPSEIPIYDNDVDNTSENNNTLTQLDSSISNKNLTESNSKEFSDCLNMQELTDNLNTCTEMNERSIVVSSVQSNESSDKLKPGNINSSDVDDSENSIYHIKWIKFNNHIRAIITQNQNGPCPMIAIANVLLLRGTIDLPKDSELISGNRLLAILSELLLSKTPDDLDDGQLINYESNFYDALCLFPSLQTGLDVNIRFTGVSDFEYTSTLSLFDLFNIHIYHGWLVDPDEHDLAMTVGKRTYNQLTEELLRLRSSQTSEDVYRSTLIEWFLNQSGSQLTFHGLSQLVSTLRDEELAVFFRNNHFSTILKHKDSIYVLVTDMGLLNEPKIVWELLNDLDGDTQFVDCSFQLFCPSTSTPPSEESSDAVRIITIKSDKNNSKYNTDSKVENNKDTFIERQYYPNSLTSYNVSESNSTSLDYELSKMLQEEEIKASNQDPEKFWKLYK